MKTDAIVVGSGPNGLAAAITLQRASLKVTILEKASEPGGGARSRELTLPGFLHDVCSAVHPLTMASPFFQSLELEKHGLQWVVPPAAVAHPFDDEPAALLYPSIEQTAAELAVDKKSYQRLMQPFVDDWRHLAPVLLGPLRLQKNIHKLIPFGLAALRSASGLAAGRFETSRARALFAGLAAHSILPLQFPGTAAFGLILGLLGHVTGWPFPRGGAQKITDMLVNIFLENGGRLELNHKVRSSKNIPPARLTLLDITPRQFLKIYGDTVPAAYQRQLQKFRYGPGVFKIDFALSEPIPFRDNRCLEAASLHLGNSADEIYASEKTVWSGEHAETPYVLLVQPTLFDSSRATEGKHIAWAYCHVPHGSSRDMTAIIEQQIERFAPGFKDTVLARHIMNSEDMQRYNPNYVGGDINGGSAMLPQLFTRPMYRLSPYKTPLQNVFLCSSSTPPGGGVHGMSGYHAARVALAGHNG